MLRNTNEKKSPNPVDKQIGARVRMRRMMLGKSQEWLAMQLDLTFQQVQKYEKGANRIGGSRMQQIATALQTPVAFFFSDQEQADKPADDFSPAFWATPGAIELAKDYAAIKDNDLRTIVRSLTHKLAEAA